MRRSGLDRAIRLFSGMRRRCFPGVALRMRSFVGISRLRLVRRPGISLGFVALHPRIVMSGIGNCSGRVFLCPAWHCGCPSGVRTGNALLGLQERGAGCQLAPRC